MTRSDSDALAGCPHPVGPFVRGRVVFIEGCSPRGEVRPLSRQLEAFVRTIPNVQQAVASVYSDPQAKPPYRTLTPPTSSRP